MRRVIVVVLLALSLAGCGQEIPLPTRAAWGGGCLGDLWRIADVIADPTSGAPTDAATGEPFIWTNAFTARRGLFGVEVLDPQGRSC